MKSSLAGAVKSPQRVKLEPVGVFWDIENCQVPPNKSAFALAAKMRRFFFEGKREAEFMCVCDVTKERKEVIEALNKAQVSKPSVQCINVMMCCVHVLAQYMYIYYFITNIGDSKGVQNIFMLSSVLRNIAHAQP